MPRKTVMRRWAVEDGDLASMRPRPDAAENRLRVVHGDVIALLQ